MEGNAVWLFETSVPCPTPDAGNTHRRHKDHSLSSLFDSNARVVDMSYRTVCIMDVNLVACLVPAQQGPNFGNVAASVMDTCQPLQPEHKRRPILLTLFHVIS